MLEAHEADKANKAQLLLLMAALGKVVANQKRLAAFERVAMEAIKDFVLYPSQNTPLSSPLPSPSSSRASTPSTESTPTTST